MIFHSDGVQTFGKIRIDDKKMFVDSFSISAYKTTGQKGAWAINGNLAFRPLPMNTNFGRTSQQRKEFEMN
jgi:cysteine sulfinate desulfinase/cysteine desulfurase-like protein